jgi:hypothetical protein
MTPKVHLPADRTSTASQHLGKPRLPIRGLPGPDQDIPAARGAPGILSAMKKAVPLALGGLMTVVGLVWTLQGLGYMTGSPMTGVATSAIIGPIVAGFGVALMIVASQRGGRP